MILYCYPDAATQSAAGAALGEADWADVALHAVLDHRARRYPASEERIDRILKQHELFLRRGMLSVFFDRYGAYLAHAVTVRIAESAQEAVAADPRTRFLPRVWADGPANWVLHLAAVNRSTATIVRTLASSLQAGDGPVHYVRDRGGGPQVRRWSAAMLSRAVSREASADERREQESKAAHWFGGQVRRATESMAMYRLMARDPERVWSLGEAAMQVTMARTLAQFRLARGSDGVVTGALLYAWLSDPVMKEIADGRTAALRPQEWNCGRTPCIITRVGDPVAVDRAVADWRNALPPGAGAPKRLVVDRLFEENRFADA